jgi:NAD(P)-dependent dehydrogenase (short-subunit alcohol dehydrogenase family)
VNIDGAVALITGGASGLGHATAQALHDRGARVVLLDLPSSNGDLAARNIGTGANFTPADVTSTDDVASAIDFACALGDLRVSSTVPVLRHQAKSWDGRVRCRSPNSSALSGSTSSAPSM